MAANKKPLAHFHGPDVLDPVFQQLVARGVGRRDARRRIREVLEREDDPPVIMAHIAAGAWALRPREYKTEEEEEQARLEFLAAAERFDHVAQRAIMYEQSPSPDGIFDPIVPEDWEERAARIAIRNEHLVIEFLNSAYSPEAYTFAIANQKALDELLAAAPPASKSPARPPRPLRGTKKWVWKSMQDNPEATPKEIWANRPDKAEALTLKTVENLVSSLRKESRALTKPSRTLPNTPGKFSR